MGKVSEIKIQLFAEGDTEFNYFKSLRTKKNLKITYKEVNVGGGGYKNVISKMKKESDMGYLAKVVIVDYDLAREKEGERQNFKNLVDYCISKNKNGRIPYILVVNNYDFEYFSCLHSSDYKNQDTTKFILDKYSYKTLEEYKSDTKLYDKLNSDGNSVLIALEALNNQNCKQRRQTVVSNSCAISQKGIEIKITNAKIIYTPEADTF